MSDGTIAGEHGLRVLIRWNTEGDLIPTYQVVADYYRDWNAVMARHPTYQSLLDEAGPVLGADEDITCDVSGVHIVRGRTSITAPVDAGTLDMSINDDTGYYDPRVLAAGRPTRVGSRVIVEVEPNFAGTWYRLFTGFVETWNRGLSADSASDVRVTASDAFHLLARTRDTPTEPAVGANELSGARVNRYLQAGGVGPKWGTLAIDTGTIAMNPTAVDNDLLNELHRVEASEDGMFDVKADGTIRFRQEGWRDRHMAERNNLELCVVDLTGTYYDDRPLNRPILCPVSFVASDDNLDIINRVLVARSVRFDPDLPNGNRPETVWRKGEDLTNASQVGLQSRSWDELPHTTDARSLVLADRWVDRYSAGANRVGQIAFNLVKRPEDANTVVLADWGDRVEVMDMVTGHATETFYEVVGVAHDITPEDWTWQLDLDTWVGEVASPGMGRWDTAQWDVDKWAGSTSPDTGYWGRGRWGRHHWG